MNLAASVENGFVFTSTDGGVSWAEHPTPLNLGGQMSTGGIAPFGVAAIASSADGMRLVCCVAGGVGHIWTSKDGGTTWLEHGTNDGDVIGGEASWSGVASSADGMILLATAYYYDGRGVFTSEDGGATWTKVATPGVDAANTYSFKHVAIAADGGFRAAIFAQAGMGGVWTSENSGADWVKDTTPGNTTSWRDLAMSPKGDMLVALLNYPGGKWDTTELSGAWALERVVGAPTSRPTLSPTGVPTTFPTKEKSTVFKGCNDRPRELNWRTVALSGDGKVQVAAGWKTGIHTSENGGNSWGEVRNTFAGTRAALHTHRHTDIIHYTLARTHMHPHASTRARSIRIHQAYHVTSVS
jgi:hypothetical protein